MGGGGLSSIRDCSKTVLEKSMGVSKNLFPWSTTSENNFLDTHLVSTIFLAT